MGLIHSDDLTVEECLELFRLAHYGRIALSLSALPIVVPVAYLLTGMEFVIGFDSEQIARAIADNRVLALHADGWSEDLKRRWTVLAIGTTKDQALQEKNKSPNGEPARVWGERYLVGLVPEFFSGRWLGGNA